MSGTCPLLFTRLRFQCCRLYSASRFSWVLFWIAGATDLVVQIFHQFRNYCQTLIVIRAYYLLYGATTSFTRPYRRLCGILVVCDALLLAVLHLMCWHHHKPLFWRGVLAVQQVLAPFHVLLRFGSAAYLSGGFLKRWSSLSSQTVCSKDIREFLHSISYISRNVKFLFFLSNSALWYIMWLTNLIFSSEWLRTAGSQRDAYIQLYSD